MPLSYLQRPADLQAAIDAKYAEISAKPVSDWTEDGTEGPYLLANCNEHSLILAIVEARLQLGQTDFYFLDVGAGCFTWGRYLAKFLTEQFQNPRFQQYGNFCCHIVSVSGEAHGEPTAVTTQFEYWAQHRQKILNCQREIIQGVVEEDLTRHTDITRILTGEYCRLYEFGNVKLENIQAVLPERLLEAGAPVLPVDLLDTFDFAISSSSLHHLLDGAGTLVQVLDMLKIDGIAEFHGFRASITDTVLSESDIHPCSAILGNLGMPFFIAMSYIHNPTCFIQKNVSGAVNLPLEYETEQRLDLYPRAHLIPTAAFRAPTFLKVSSYYAEDRLTTLDGLRFYNTLTRVAQRRGLPQVPGDLWIEQMQRRQRQMFLDLARVFEIDTQRVEEGSPLLPSHRASIEAIEAEEKEQPHVPKY